MKVADILKIKGHTVETVHSWTPVSEAIHIGDVVRRRVDELRLEADVLRDMYLAHR